MLRKKSLTEEQLMKLARSKGKSRAKNSLRTIINCKNVKLRNNQSLKDLTNFCQGSKKQSMISEKDVSSQRFKTGESIVFDRLEVSKSSERKDRLCSKSPHSKTALISESQIPSKSHSRQKSLSQSKRAKSLQKQAQTQRNQGLIKIAEFDQNEETSIVNVSAKRSIQQQQSGQKSQNNKIQNTKQKVLNDQIVLLKQYITYLEDTNHSLDQQNQQTKKQNLRILQQLQEANSKICHLTKTVLSQSTINTQSSSETQILNLQNSRSECIQTEAQPIDEELKELQEFKQILKQDPEHTRILNNINKLKFSQGLSSFVEQQIKLMTGPLEKQNSLLRQMIKLDKMEFEAKEAQLKLLLKNTESTIKQLMCQFRSEQCAKKNIFATRLTEERKLHGIMSQFA